MIFKAMFITRSGIFVDLVTNLASGWNIREVLKLEMPSGVVLLCSLVATDIAKVGITPP